MINKAFIAFIVPLLLIAACESPDTDTNQTVNVTSNQSVDVEESGTAKKILSLGEIEDECPHECCDDDEGYQDKKCEYDRECVKNRCVFEDCPYECCSGYEKYARQRCDDGYKCDDHECVPDDNDGDGLLNIEEDDYNTNEDDPDTDDDGLTDYEEVKKLKTDPLNNNTDGDRYGDAEDPDPLVATFPEISIELDDEKVEEHKDNIQALSDAYAENCQDHVCTVDEMVELLGDLELYTLSFTVKRKNTGDDYSDYTKYRLSVYTLSSGDDERILPILDEELSRIEAHSKDEKDYEFVVKLSDVERVGEGYLAGIANGEKIPIWPEMKKIEHEGLEE